MLSKIESRQQDRFGRIGSIVSIFSILLFFALGSDAFVPTKTIIPKRFFGRNGILIQRRSTVGLDVLENVDAMVLEEQEDLELATLDTMEIKRLLLELLPRMTGTPQDLVSVESYVNTLEDRYTPVQTLDFLNLAMAGEWQLLFSTNLSGGPKPHFRLREMFQRVEATSLEGAIANQATWDLAEDGSTFDATGTFTVKCSYKINQGARMVMNLEDHVIELAKGSVVPKDVQDLVGLLHRAMPKELFDPTEHAMDTTYLDGDLRIVRMTGPRLEGVRDIFIRRGSMEINPVKDC
jgi:hypothetical protein